MNSRYIRNYFVAVVVGGLVVLSASAVSAQLIGWFDFSPAVRTFLTNQSNTVAALKARVDAGQTATDLDCFGCVGPGEVGQDAVGWVQLDPELREYVGQRANRFRVGILEDEVAAQFDQINTLQEQLDNLSGGVTVLDFTDPDACVIDQPGEYTLDRDWRFSESGNDLCLAESGVLDTHILISANDVIFDLNGFTLRSGLTDDVIVLEVTGDSVSVRNGLIFGGDCTEETGISLDVSGSRALIENIFIIGCIQVSNGVVRDSNLQAVLLGQGSVIQYSDIRCGRNRCLEVGSDTIVRFNRIGEGGGIDIRGDNVLVEGNVLEDDRNGIGINGNNNTIVRNTLQGFRVEIAISVGGTGNIIDSNIVKPVVVVPGDQVQEATGIRFSMDGNFYGDNRVSATTPFDLRGTIQTDWGGNVSF